MGKYKLLTPWKDTGEIEDRIRLTQGYHPPLLHKVGNKLFAPVHIGGGYDLESVIYNWLSDLPQGADRSIRNSG
jgi:hypothetical protein